MKKIIFEGNEYEVEKWVNFISKDEDGEVKAHEVAPVKGTDYWCALDRFSTLMNADGSWRDSLTKV